MAHQHSRMTERAVNFYYHLPIRLKDQTNGWRNALTEEQNKLLEAAYVALHELSKIVRQENPCICGHTITWHLEHGDFSCNWYENTDNPCKCKRFTLKNG